ncbi:MAG TPA: class I SAM-dependent methyltransferase [bacterium]|nr:class I SAM-dependent methyltransferase [bacterium]HPN35906.1 class I SAM-dependent methyltransferase [bacterium]
MPAMYDRFAPFYELEYGHKKDDVDFYLNIVGRYGSPVLEIGVGTGRIALSLAAQGHEVCGVDNSAPMLQIARDKVRRMDSETRKRLTLRRADMRRLRFRDAFRTAIIPFRAFLHNLSQQEQMQTLNGLHRALRPRGVLALDLFVPLYQVLARTTWQVEIPEEDLAPGVTIASSVRHTPAEQRLDIENRYHQSNRIRRAQMTYRYIFRYEMEALLRAAGFKAISCLNGFNGKPYDFFSGLMIFIARKQ